MTRMLILAMMLQSNPVSPKAPDAAPAARENVSAVDSLKLVSAARAAITHFLEEWRNAWLASEMDFTGRSAHIVFNPTYGKFIRNPKEPREDASVDDDDPMELYNSALNGMRLRALHCHLPIAVNRTQFSKTDHMTLHVMPVRSRGSARSMCPSWILGPRAGLASASRVIDSALTPLRRDDMRGRRDALLGILDSSVALLSGDDQLTAQRVRFLLDQGDTMRVQHAIASCRASSTTCLLLRDSQQPKSTTFRVQRARRSGSREHDVQGPEFRVQNQSDFRVQGSGFRVQGSGFRVQGSVVHSRTSRRHASTWHAFPEPISHPPAVECTPEP